MPEDEAIGSEVTGEEAFTGIVEAGSPPSSDPETLATADEDDPEPGTLFAAVDMLLPTDASAMTASESSEVDLSAACEPDLEFEGDDETGVLASLDKTTDVGTKETSEDAEELGALSADV